MWGWKCCGDGQKGSPRLLPPRNAEDAKRAQAEVAEVERRMS